MHLMEVIGTTDVDYLGYGMYSLVYETQSGTILKYTLDRSCTEYLKHLELDNKLHPRVIGLWPSVAKVDYCGGVGIVNVIEMERYDVVYDPSKADLLEMTIEYFLDKLKEPKFLPASVLNLIKRNKEFEILEPGALRLLDKCASSLNCSHADILKTVILLKQTMRKFDCSLDIHDENVMYDSARKSYVLTDPISQRGGAYLRIFNAYESNNSILNELRDKIIGAKGGF